MSKKDPKMSGIQRRGVLLEWLQRADDPLTGTALAQQANVSRQVIVQDISLLKAGGEPIIATSRGYIYWQEEQKQKVERVIVVNHSSQNTRAELYTLVDCGVLVQNVMVDHPVYGDLSGSLMLTSRRDVDGFIEEMQKTGASLLLELTGGIHMHTIQAETEEQVDEACAALRQSGILVESKDKD